MKNQLSVLTACIATHIRGNAPVNNHVDAKNRSESLLSEPSFGVAFGASASSGAAVDSCRRSHVRIAVVLFLAMAALCFVTAFSPFVPVAHAATKNITITVDQFNDDPSIIKDSLKWARNNDGELTVTLKAGVYEMTKPAYIYSNTHLVLEDGVTLRSAGYYHGLIYNHGDIYTKDSPDELVKWETVGGYSLSHDITIEGHGSATIDGNCYSDFGGSPTKALDTHDLIRIDHAQDITIKGIAFKNCYGGHHVEYVGVKNGTISNCSFSGFRRQLGHEKDRSYGRECVELDACWADDTEGVSDLGNNFKGERWASSTLLDGTNCQNCSVTNCTFSNMASAIGEHHYSSDKRYKNSHDIVIANNTIKGARNDKMLRYAITVGGLDNTTVTGNKITGSFLRGIAVYQAKSAVIKNNTVDGCDVGIFLATKATSAKVEGNTVKNSKNYGVATYSSSTVSSISKNIISSVETDGIYANGSSVSEISSNRISGAKWAAVSVRCKVSSVSSNKVSSSKRGVVVQKSTTDKVSSNAIAGASYCGIAVQGSAKVGKISSNKITKAKKYGIRLTSKAKKVKVSGNTVQVHKKKYGVSKTKKVKAKLSKNKIKKW